MQDIHETYRIRRAVKLGAQRPPSVETRIAYTLDRAQRIAERESATHAGLYVVDLETNLTNTPRPIATYRDGKLVDEA